MVASCGPAAEPPGVDLDELRRQVENFRASVEARLATSAILADSTVEEAGLALRLDTPKLMEILGRVGSRYLERVELDLRPDARIRASDDVRVSLGLFRANAGRWNLDVRITSVYAQLGAGTPVMEPIAVDRIGVRLPVAATAGRGTAEVLFQWDARSVASAVCRDFDVFEAFDGEVVPQEYLLEGAFALQLREGSVIVVPELDQELFVQPQPTEASWARVREILDRQDSIFRCGIALDAEKLETMLRELMARGFRFRLPDSLLRPIELPAGAADTVTLNDRGVTVVASPVGLRLRRDWLWYGLDLDVIAAE